MIRISQIKINVKEASGNRQLLKKAAAVLRLKETEISALKVVRRSVDARKRPDIFYSYTVDVEIASSCKGRAAGRKEEERIVKRLKNPDICLTNTVKYSFPERGTEKLKHRPVIIGTGPAGLFCGYFLARFGYAPVLLERGADVETRKADVERFWREGILNPASNVQFGEGGAGTFSDGKLNTLVKDKFGRNGAVLETFVRFGAKESILYDAKPHIGTDELCGIVRRMREEILRLGGEVRFHSQVTKLLLQDGRIKGVVINGSEELPCEQAVLAIGHSARDTLESLYASRIPMESKAFAVGLRVEHPQSLIDQSQYGTTQPGVLGAAPYKVTAKTRTGRGVYSFCMCPGGYVVNASSEPGRLAVNGMSYSARDGRNANSAVIVSVTPADYGSDHPLAGIAFQRGLEEKAYLIGQGKIPVQRYGDFRHRVEENGTGAEKDSGTEKGPADCLRIKDEFEGFAPQTKGAYLYADISRILPEECSLAFVEGMTEFGRRIPGFDHPMVLLSGVESRTSSPVRILRDETLQSTGARGLYPCGEGAGYAGGITSAAMDGIKMAEEIARRYAPLVNTPEKE